jgi:excisionase family DNA binding protein
MATEFVTCSEAARIIGVSATHIRYWHAKGTLKATRTSGGWRLFRRADVEALAASRRAID